MTIPDQQQTGQRWWGLNEVVHTVPGDHPPSTALRGRQRQVTLTCNVLTSAAPQAAIIPTQVRDEPRKGSSEYAAGLSQRV